MSFSILFLAFSFYSFLGWFTETLYCSIGARKFVYRGFLHGPVCPIYGFGAIAILLCLEPFSKLPWLVFILGTLIASLLEYFVSYLLEKLFHKSWWDYSNKKFNLNGRICLLNSLFWGILAIALVYFLQPFFMNLALRIESIYLSVITVTLLILFALDLFLSVRQTLDFNKSMQEISKLTQKIESLKTQLAQSLSSLKTDGKEKLEADLAELLQNRTDKVNLFLARSKRIRTAFPKMRLHHKDRISLIERLHSYRNKG